MLQPDLVASKHLYNDIVNNNIVNNNIAVVGEVFYQNKLYCNNKEFNAWITK